MTPAGLLAVASILAAADAPSAPPPASAFAALGDAAVQDLAVLGETRPILLRLRVMVGDRPFRSAWDESVRALHARLDRDADGKLTTAEAAADAPAGRPRVEPDVAPKDGIVSVDELAESLRADLGPLRVRGEGVPGRRTDALFDHLDRDKDGQLAKAELAAIAGSLRRLDGDDDELIAAVEVAPPEIQTVATMGRPARAPAAPTVIELVAGESPLRVVRMLLRKYDTGSSRGPGRPDSKLSPEEFAIGAAAFAGADANGDGLLVEGELRRYLAEAPCDAILDVALATEPDGRPSARVRDEGGGAPKGIAVRQVAEGVVEVDVGPIRLDIRVDDGSGAADAARRALQASFEAADANEDGYIEESELAQANGQPSPLTALFKSFDRDGDGKVYPRELDEYVARQAAEARGRLTLTASNEGRAIFGMVDLDRDRRLGAREVLDTFARVSACDRDGDGRIAPDEIPHHIRLTLARGELDGPIVPAAVGAVVVTGMSLTPTPARPAAGPPWFRRMDRNRDGDVSRREFLGPRESFERLDRDGDGLLSPVEAEAARPIKAPGG